jgi:hypothetical protein
VLGLLQNQWSALEKRFTDEAIPTIRDLNDRLAAAGIPNVFGGRPRPVP